MGSLIGLEADCGGVGISMLLVTGIFWVSAGGWAAAAAGMIVGVKQMRMPGRLPIYCLFVSALLAAVGAGGDETNNKSLPKVVLLGDSIRLSYTAAVRSQLEGKAEVISPSANGGDSSNLLRHLDAWAIQEQPDVVCFNCGIHDTKKFSDPERFQVSPTDYENNLRQIVKQLRTRTTAAVIFATTTPILDERAAEVRKGRDYVLLGSSVLQYNEIARKVMRELDVPILDLHAQLTMPDSPQTTQTLLSNDGVHLTDAGRTLLGRFVAEAIAEQLNAE